MTSGGISNSERDEESSAVTGSENRNARFMNSLIRAELLGERGWEMGIGESSHFSNSIRVGGKYEVGSPNVLRCEKSVYIYMYSSQLMPRGGNLTFSQISFI